MMPSLLIQAFFIENHDCKRFSCRGEHVHTYISGSRCAWWQKTTNRHTHTHTRDNYSNPRCAHVRRGLIMHLGKLASYRILEGERVHKGMPPEK